jgi:hypothetical protein
MAEIDLNIPVIGQYAYFDSRKFTLITPYYIVNTESGNNVNCHYSLVSKNDPKPHVKCHGIITFISKKVDSIIQPKIEIKSNPNRNRYQNRNRNRNRNRDKNQNFNRNQNQNQNQNDKDVSCRGCGKGGYGDIPCRCDFNIQSYDDDDSYLSLERYAKYGASIAVGSGSFITIDNGDLAKDR